MTKRLDQLTGPVEIGQSYLVPTVTAEWKGRVKNWPVIGPKHSDAQCLDFDYQHYHLDARFLSNRSTDQLFWRDVIAAPLMSFPRLNPAGLPAPVWRRRRCRQLQNPRAEYIRTTLAAPSRQWRCHFEQWEGKQARHDGRGWVCPHRMVPLADHPAVGGVITCPLHLLRIDATTGVVLPQEQAVPA